MFIIPDEINLRAIDRSPFPHPAFESAGISVDVLRFDKIHAEISGNKWFKLKHYLLAAEAQNKHTLLTSGGAFSNHILATSALACIRGMKSVGLIRGEEPLTLSTTLQKARRNGMHLKFISRIDFDSTDMIASAEQEFPDALWIPAGGAGAPGISGSIEQVDYFPVKEYSHVACAVGTGTGLEGLVRGIAAQPPGSTPMAVLGVRVLKGFLHAVCVQGNDSVPYTMFNDYHFGGYAKKTAGLIEFMNGVYDSCGIPTDFVYTAKLFFAVTDLAVKRYFPVGSRLLLIHSGGLQGNDSLPKGTLRF